MVRPIYHLHPEQYWMNDPNGPVFIDGELHMFYQHNPKEAIWGNMTWGHAVSRDLVHWRHMPNALHPDMPYDKDGVFSGCCVMHDGLPHILYTGVQPEVLCLAVGDAKGTAFEKHPDNPILRMPSEDCAGWRDPFVWKQQDGYRMLIGSGKKDADGYVDIYKSQDLVHWEHLGQMASYPEEAAGFMWECPNFFMDKDGDAALMISSIPHGHVYAMRGRYAGDRMQVSRPYRYDLGDSFYAPNIVCHADGRVLQYGWMRECGDPQLRAQQGWQGDLTLPRELRLVPGGIQVRPAQEVNALRGECLLDRRNFTLHSGENALKGIRGQHLEIRIQFEPGSNELLLEMLRGAASACARLSYRGADDSVWLDPTSLSGGEERLVGGVVDGYGQAELRVFLDGTAIEAFINGRETLTTRAYPTEGCDGLRLYSEGGVRVSRLQVYAMQSAYAEE